MLLNKLISVLGNCIMHQANFTMLSNNACVAFLIRHSGVFLWLVYWLHEPYLGQTLAIISRTRGEKQHYQTSSMSQRQQYSCTNHRRVSQILSQSGSCPLTEKGQKAAAIVTFKLKHKLFIPATLVRTQIFFFFFGRLRRGGDGGGKAERENRTKNFFFSRVNLFRLLCGKKKNRTKKPPSTFRDDTVNTFPRKCKKKKRFRF